MPKLTAEKRLSKAGKAVYDALCVAQSLGMRRALLEIAIKALLDDICQPKVSKPKKRRE